MLQGFLFGSRILWPLIYGFCLASELSVKRKAQVSGCVICVPSAHPGESVPGYSRTLISEENVQRAQGAIDINRSEGAHHSIGNPGVKLLSPFREAFASFWGWLWQPLLAIVRNSFPWTLLPAHALPISGLVKPRIRDLRSVPPFSGLVLALVLMSAWCVGHQEDHRLGNQALGRFHFLDSGGHCRFSRLRATCCFCGYGPPPTAVW